jgi:hypothetical protein
MSEDRLSYVRAVLAAYIDLPDTPDRPRPPDRVLADQLFDRQIPIATVYDALILAFARRTLRDPEAPPLPRVRSLYYFLPVIEEIVQTPLPKMYVDYLRMKLTRAGFNPGSCSKNRVSS